MAVSRGKMLGHYSPGSGGYKCWCCTNDRMTRDAKRREAREVAQEIAAEREYVSRLWAQDWDSPEDSTYDTLS